MSNGKKKILSIPIAIALCVLALATQAQIMHWPFGSELRLTCVLAIGVLYLFRYGFKKSKNIKDSVKVIMVLSWALLSVFVMYRMSNLVYLQIILGVSGISWLAMETWDIIMKKPMTERANLPQLIGMFILMAHVIFQIQHWPFAGPMLILSLAALILLAFGFILDSSKRSDSSHQIGRNA